MASPVSSRKDSPVAFPPPLQKTSPVTAPAAPHEDTPMGPPTLREDTPIPSPTSPHRDILMGPPTLPHKTSSMAPPTSPHKIPPMASPTSPHKDAPMTSPTPPHKTPSMATKTMAAFNVLYQKARHEIQHRIIVAQWLSEPVDWETLEPDVKNALAETHLGRYRREFYRLILADHHDPAAVDAAYLRYEEELADLDAALERQQVRAEAIKMLRAENQAIRQEIVRIEAETNLDINTAGEVAESQ